jgi:hypothetical protein
LIYNHDLSTVAASYLLEIVNVLLRKKIIMHYEKNVFSGMVSLTIVGPLAILRWHFEIEQCTPTN